MTSSREVLYFHAVRDAATRFADVALTLEGRVRLSDTYEPGFSSRTTEFTSLEIIDAEGSALSLLLPEPHGSEVFDILCRVPSSASIMARVVARHDSIACGASRPFLGLVEGFQWVSPDTQHPEPHAATLRSSDLEGRTLEDGRQVPASAKRAVRSPAARLGEVTTTSPDVPAVGRRRLLGAALTLFGVAAGTSVAALPTVARATPAGDIALADILAKTTAMLAYIEDAVRTWNEMLEKTNRVMSAAEKTRDFVKDLNTKENIFYVQAKQLSTYAATFFKRDSDFLKSRFVLFDLNSQVLYRYVNDNLYETDRIYKQWKRQAGGGETKFVDDQMFRESPLGSGMVSASRSTYQTHLSEFQTNNLESQNDRLLENITSQADSDMDRAKMYGDLVEPIRTKVGLEQLRILAEISHSLNDIKHILLKTPVPSGAGLPIVTEQDYTQGLRTMKEHGTRKKLDAKRKKQGDRT